MNCIKRLSYLLLILLLAAGCKKSPVLGEREMEALLYDLHIADAIMDKKLQSGTISDSLRNSMYASVFEKHHVTKAQFDTSAAWYGRHLKQYLAIYNRLNTRFIEERDVYLAQAESSIPVPETDSVDIWDESPEIVFSKLQFPIIYRFSYALPENEKAKQYRLQFNTFGINRKMRVPPRVLLLLHYSGTDSVATRSLLIRNDGRYALDLPVDSGMRPTLLSGSFFVPPYNNHFYRIVFSDIELQRLSK